MVRRSVNGKVVRYCDYTGMIITDVNAFYPKFNKHNKLIKSGQYLNWEVVMRVAFELRDEQALAYLRDLIDPCLHKAPSYEMLEHFGGALTCGQYVKECAEDPRYKIGRDVSWVCISPRADEDVTNVHTDDIGHSLHNRHQNVLTGDPDIYYKVHYRDQPIGEFTQRNPIAVRVMNVEAYGNVYVTRMRKLSANDVRDVGLSVEDFRKEFVQPRSCKTKRKVAEPKSMSKEEFEIEKVNLAEAFHAFEMNLAKTADRPRTLSALKRDRSAARKKPKRPETRTDDAA